MSEKVNSEENKLENMFITNKNFVVVYLLIKLSSSLKYFLIIFFMLFIYFYLIITYFMRKR
jgi:hypothetical protein